MKKSDGRKLSHEVLEEMRIQSVKAVIQRKQSPEKVIAILGFYRSCIYIIVDGHPAHKQKKLKNSLKVLKED